MKCLDITLDAGKILHIPAFWWYSIKFGKDSSITSFFYRTYMNNIAITPHIFMYALQQQNVKRDVVKKHPIEQLNKIGIIDPPVIETQNVSDINDLPDIIDINNLPDKENIIAENKVLVVSAI